MSAESAETPASGPAENPGGSAQSSSGGEFHLGGQAVLEGVMMRSPHYVAVAVRRADGEILVRGEPFESATRRSRLLGFPVVRGVVALYETLVLGLRALNFSASVAMEDVEPRKQSRKGSASEERRSESEKSPETPEAQASVKGSAKAPTSEGGLGKTTIALTMTVGFALGVGLFVVLPNAVAARAHAMTANPLSLNLIEGGLRLLIFLVYLGVISLLPDIRRVFQYHGAEHKVVHAVEAGRGASIEKAREFPTAHARCGTSFVFIVILASIIVFAFLGWGPWYQRILGRLVLLPLVAGIAYEIVKFVGTRQQLGISKLLALPGLWSQVLTARQPTDEMLEVAVRAMEEAVAHERAVTAGATGQL